MAERLSQPAQLRPRPPPRVSRGLQHRRAGQRPEHSQLQHSASRLPHRPLLYRRALCRRTLERTMPKFEDSLKQLETIVGQLEQGDLPLEDSLKLFEEGMRLSAACKEELDVAEGKVQLM